MSGDSAALAICPQPEVRVGAISVGGRSSSNPGLAKSGSGQTSSMGQASSGNSQENGLSSEGNRGLTENRQSFGGMFDEMFGKMHTAGAHAKDFSETAVGIKGSKSEVAGGSSIGPGGLLVYQSPLSQATKSGSTAAVEALLKAGVDANSGSSVLHGIIAAYSSLGESAQKGDVQTVEALLKAGADPNLGTRYGPFGLCSQFTPLAAAANNGHTEAVRALIRAGADANSGVHIGPVGPLIAQYTPLGRACRNGHTETMKALLEAGANPNVGLSLGPFGTIGTYSLLGHAAAHGNVEAVRALLTAGANPNEGLSFGPLGSLASMSPLEHAARNGHTECVKALLEFGADPDKGFAVGPFGILAHANPLVHAAANGHAEAVEALIAAGAAPAGVYPWSHLDPARGCMQPETSDEGENGGGKVEKHNKLKRQTSIVHVIDENTGLAITVEISPEQQEVDELHAKLAEKEDLLGRLRAEQHQLKRQLTVEKHLSSVLKEAESGSGGESETGSPGRPGGRTVRRASLGGALPTREEIAAALAAEEGASRGRRKSLGCGELPPGSSSGEFDADKKQEEESRTPERDEGFGSPEQPHNAAVAQTAMRTELGGL